MFPSRFFPDRYFAPRYWPKVGGAGTNLPTGCRTGFTFANDGVWNFTVDCDDA